MIYNKIYTKGKTYDHPSYDKGDKNTCIRVQQGSNGGESGMLLAKTGTK